MRRPIIYDVTHILHRISVEAPTGIDRIDLDYGGYFGSNPAKIAGGIYYGLKQPQFMSSENVCSLISRIERERRENRPIEQDATFASARGWLLGRRVKQGLDAAKVRDSGNEPKYKFKLKSSPYLRYMKFWGSSSELGRLPENAIYLNIAQHAFEYSAFFDWLSGRPDVKCVFFVHDLLPLDYPEFWPAGHEIIFEKRVATIARHASALLTTSAEVRDRLGVEMARRGRASVPIFARAFPSPFRQQTFETCYDSELFREPYFVVLGTIEPRKNHLLLLNIWRELAQKSELAAKLVVVGRRGWENEQTVDVLERSRQVAPHVLEIANMTNAGLCRLLANARALLMPSFAEGYGLPLVEALGLKTPVIASDLPVFRETTQGNAIFRSPLDGIGWMDSIQRLASVSADAALKSRLSAPAMTLPAYDAYFAAVDEFLANL